MSSERIGWPELQFESWNDTRETLHRWMQIVGKIRMELTPLINHWWNVPLYVSARGLTTSTIPCGDRWFDMEFDFVEHVLRTRVSDGTTRDIALAPRSVADFYAEVSSMLRSLGIECHLWHVPVELVNPTPLDTDHEHRSYDPAAAQRFWRVLALTAAVFTKFRGEFIGKCSPVHFFWGSFDLAVTRFSGRRAPERAGADPVTREAYSHEVSSVGFWPGDSRLTKPTFFSYAAPEPPGFSSTLVQPEMATYNSTFGGFYLDYEAVRTATDPEALLLAFCRSTYEAAAVSGKWDRDSLERHH